MDLLLANHRPLFVWVSTVLEQRSLATSRTPQWPVTGTAMARAELVNPTGNPCSPAQASNGPANGCASRHQRPEPGDPGRCRPHGLSQQPRVGGEGHVGTDNGGVGAQTEWCTTALHLRPWPAEPRCSPCAASTPKRVVSFIFHERRRVRDVAVDRICGRTAAR